LGGKVSEKKTQNEKKKRPHRTQGPLKASEMEKKKEIHPQGKTEKRKKKGGKGRSWGGECWSKTEKKNSTSRKKRLVNLGERKRGGV